MKRWLLLVISIFAAGCATSPPADVNDICAIFREKGGWYEDADDARDRWGTPIPVMMAIMHQESRFKAKAKPPRRKILWFIPGPRPSNSYGYTQALKETWQIYQRDAGNYGADRDDFADSIDFIGWYSHQSYRRSGILTTVFGVSRGLGRFQQAQLPQQAVAQGRGEKGIPSVIPVHAAARRL